MRRELDAVVLENKCEINTIMEMIAKYVKDNPKEKNNETIKRLYDLLDIMDMEW